MFHGQLGVVGELRNSDDRGLAAIALRMFYPEVSVIVGALMCGIDAEAGCL